MTVSVHTDTTSTAVAGAVSHGLPLELISLCVFVACVVIALVVLASYPLYRGPSFREMLDGRARRRARNSNP